MTRRIELIAQHLTVGKVKYKTFEHTPEGKVDLDIIAFEFRYPMEESWVFWHGDTSYPKFREALAAADKTISEGKTNDQDRSGN